MLKISETYILGIDIDNETDIPVITVLKDTGSKLCHINTISGNDAAVLYKKLTSDYKNGISINRICELIEADKEGRIRIDPELKIKQKEGSFKIAFPTRASAEALLNGITDLLKKYRTVTVLDVNTACGFPGNISTDSNRGWTNLDDAKIQRVSEGFIVILPEPEGLLK